MQCRINVILAHKVITTSCVAEPFPGSAESGGDERANLVLYTPRPFLGTLDRRALAHNRIAVSDPITVLPRNVMPILRRLGHVPLDFVRGQVHEIIIITKPKLSLDGDIARGFRLRMQTWHAQCFLLQLPGSG